MELGVGLVIVVAVLVVLTLVRHHEYAQRARLFRRIGFALTAVVAGLFGSFLVGETLSDPGGWKAIGLLALWGVPLGVLCLLVWFRPAVAPWALVPLVVAMTSLSIWFAVDPGAWRAFENRNGPVRAVGLFALALALALWGLHRTLAAGVLLVVIGVVPIALSSIGHDGMASLAAASAAPVITGLCYLASAAAQHRPPRANAPPSAHPKAA
ncbi:MAG: hypothetical protein M0004_02050 [Actinomycetota bacterium]|nr:hypothetical protein [Actinomycetota bacterium]